MLRAWEAARHAVRGGSLHPTSPAPLCTPPPPRRSPPSPHPAPFSLPRGNLEVIYPELGDVGCTYIPSCHQSRWRISREWGSPRVRYPRAHKVSAVWVPALPPCNAITARAVRAAFYYSRFA